MSEYETITTEMSFLDMLILRQRYLQKIQEGEIHPDSIKMEINGQNALSDARPKSTDKFLYKNLDIEEEKNIIQELKNKS